MRMRARRLAAVVTSVLVGCVSYELPDLPIEPDEGGAPEGGAHDAARDATNEPDADAGRDCASDLDSDGLYHHLDCTGLYSDFATKTVAATSLAYKPGRELWSDGAAKRRWLHLPPGTTIDVSSFDAWKMPNGTRVWKEFTVDGRLVETRLFSKTDTGEWKHTTYKWNAGATDAVRYDYGDLVPRDGGAPYEIPSTSQCSYCHDNRPDKMLGVDAIGLGLDGAEGATLSVLAAQGRLSPAPPATSLRIPDDGTGLASDAVGRLHANCGVCHSAGGIGGSTGLKMQIRASDLLPDAGRLDVYTTAVCQQASRPDPDGGTIMRIAGGAPTKSLVSILSGTRAPPGENPSSDVQMPPLVTRVVDAEGHAHLDAWITALPACP